MPPAPSLPSGTRDLLPGVVATVLIGAAATSLSRRRLAFAL
jgi:hypothetical protein